MLRVVRNESHCRQGPSPSNLDGMIGSEGEAQRSQFRLLDAESLLKEGKAGITLLGSLQPLISRMDS